MSFLPQKTLMMEVPIIMQSKCFICSEVFDAKELAEHEKICLSQLQDNLSYVTKEIDTLLNPDSESVKSAASSGSTENSHKNVRCYICGEEFGSHFITVHERQCKRKWDSGVTNHGNLKKGASLGHIPAMREVEKGKLRAGIHNEDMKKAKSVFNITEHAPKQAWNARMRDKENAEMPSKEARRKRPARKERPKSAYVKSSSSQNLNHDMFSGEELHVYDDSFGGSNLTGFGSEKAASMQDLASDVAAIEESKSRTPKFIECQYCFKMFSIHSIGIHEKKCLCRGGTEREAKARPLRKSLQSSRCVSVNELRFASDANDWSIEHQGASSLAVSSDNVSNQKIVSSNDSPRFLLCSYCKKPFGSKSLPIHLPQCQRKYEREHGLQDDGKPVKQSSTSKPGRGLYSEKSSLKHPATPSNSTTLKTASSEKAASKKSSAVIGKLGVSTVPRNGTQSNRNKPSPNGRRISSGTSRSGSSASAYVACKFCNNYYGSASVTIHETKCSAKLKRQENEKNFAQPPRRQLGRLFGLER